MKKIIEEWRFNLGELEDLVNRIEWSIENDELDENEIEMFENELEELQDLINGYFKELIKKAIKANNIAID